MNVLYINRFESRCGNCGRGCDCNEKQHNTYLGYDKNKEGCHAEYTHVSTDYSGMNPSVIRPDLIWIGSYGELKL